MCIIVCIYKIPKAGWWSYGFNAMTFDEDIRTPLEAYVILVYFRCPYNDLTTTV